MSNVLQLLVLALAAVHTSYAQLTSRVSLSHGCDSFDASCAITLTEGLDITVSLQLDEPIICSRQDLECSVIVNISNSHPDIVTVEPCFVRWPRLQWHETRTVRVTAVQSYADNGEQRVHLATDVVSLAEYYSGYDPLDLYVKSENRRTAQCRSTGDPHYTTFDGKYWHYYDGVSRNPMRVMLYRATHRDFAIVTQVIGRPARNCGIAGRENRDRVVITGCGSRVQIVSDFNSLDTSLHPRISQRGSTYTVYFHSGAWMRAQVGRGWANVYAGGVDYRRSCGLCGNFDGNRDNDVPAYRVNSYGSLFSCMKVPSTGVDLDGRTMASQGDVFTWTYRASDFGSQSSVPTPMATCPYELQRIDPIEVDGADVEDITDILRERTRDVQARTNGTLTFDAVTNETVHVPEISLDDARAVCKDRIDASTTAQVCSVSYPEFKAEIANYTEDCAIDYAELGGNATELGRQMLIASIRAIEQDCLALVIERGDGNVTALQQALCENSCSGHGTCTAGAKCNCTEGFGGTDCSVDLLSPPRILSVSELTYDSSGLQRERTPTEILVYGTNFLPSDLLRCRFGTNVTIGRFIGPTTVLCEVPIIRHRGTNPLALPLEVSNDQVLWSSSPFMFSFYDGHCQVCGATGAGSCSINPATCTIDDQCYLPGASRPATETSIANPCQQCVPGASNTEWTFVYTQTACRPIYTEAIYDHIIVGNATRGTAMITVNATANALVNIDPAYRITYTYEDDGGDDIPTQFAVNSATGLVTIIVDIDITSPAFMGMEHAASDPRLFNGFFKIKATDNAGFFTMVDVVIELVPSDGRPVFPEGGFSGTIAENSPMGSSIMNASGVPLMVWAHNPSRLVNATTDISYDWFLIPTGYESLLLLNSTTGAVTVGSGYALLDFENVQSLLFQVRARDITGLFHVTELDLAITDVPEAPTSISLSATSIPEGPAGRVVGNITVVDPEGGPYTYSTSDARFSVRRVGPVTQLVLNMAVNYEVPSQRSFNVNITATDSTSLSLTVPFVITVTDVNEPPYNVHLEALVLPSPLTVTGDLTVSVPENVTVDVPLAMVTAEDPDVADGVPQCYVADTYWIVSQNNELEVRAPLDFETMPTMNFLVVCEDDEGLQSLPVQVNVTVLDSNDAPVLASFTSNAAAMPVPEGPSRASDIVIGTVVATDMEGSTAANDIGIQVESGFSVGQISCSPNGSGRQCSADITLLASTPLDFEGVSVVGGVMPVSITLVDGADSSLTSTASINMTLSDVPELPNGVSLSRANVFEGVPAGYVVCNLTIIDSDGGSPSYDVVLSMNPMNAFSIEPYESATRHRRASGGKLWKLLVSNASAFDFESLSGPLVFSLNVTDTSVPAPNMITFTENVTVSDRPLQLSANSTSLSGVPGRRGILFTLENQDRPALVGDVQFSLKSVTSSSVSISDFVLTQGSDSCALGVSTSIREDADQYIEVVIEYSFATTAAQAVYADGSVSFELVVTDPPLPPLWQLGSEHVATPTFAPVSVAFQSTSVKSVTAVNPFGGVSNIVYTVRNATFLPWASVSTLPPICTLHRGIVYEMPLDFHTNRWVTSCEFISANYESLDKSRIFVAPVLGTYQGCDSASGVPCGIEVAQMTTGLPTSQNVMLSAAETASTYELASFVPLTVKFPDACGVDEMGVQAVASPCVERECQVSGSGHICIDTTLSSTTSSSSTSSTVTTTTPFSILAEGSMGGTDSSAGSTIGLAVGLVLLLLLVLLILIALYLRKQHKDDIDFDKYESRDRLPTYNNPTYQSAQDINGGKNYDMIEEGTYTKQFVPGVENPMYDWYQPKMTRKECSDYLSSQGEGAFVVRDSEANEGWHMLGVKTRNTVVHDKIRLTPNAGYELLPSMGAAADTKQPMFSTLPELVEYYVDVHDDMPYTLAMSNPIYDNHQLIAERTGQQVKRVYDTPALPQKDPKYEEAMLGGDGVGNPMYGIDEPNFTIQNTGNAGYLDVQATDEVN